MIMKKDLNQEQQVLEAEKNIGADKIIANPILCKELIAELRANRKAIETLSSNITILEFRLREIYHLEASVG
jgi:hypothetical protein